MRKVGDKIKIRIIKGLLEEKKIKKHENKTQKMTRKFQKECYMDLSNEKQNGMK